ncbi:putative Zn(II)2Cys6 transcription factor-like protein [Lindgomyces ingoldianus]|uniref:Zn(II)2Cys6 transcription factor-like protein n=1 Tax=Lindgomyces ingoldianus TaxID=673940 RepID=A0ACB6QFM2_9PLEO|nr:putative Zn(II)2Cys6 transcription factor-like protein [Lindgomyces ingoldianus]KAF2465692.1 putative Zn(II)2Cys6 transcription factor-like protein [Lindgomyces ingoldianus]
MAEPRPRQRKFAPRSRQGCLTCRVRRKRCDGQRPDCQNCTRLNVKCEWQTQRQIVTETSTRSATPASESAMCTLRRSVDPWSAFTGDEGNEKRHLLSYYIDAYVPSISVATTPSSFYTRLYIPMALESEGVLDAVIALSSAQLARRTANPDRAQHLRNLSSQHQVKCHAFLRGRISPIGQPVMDVYQVIAVTLLLVGLEALNGTKSTRWLAQLQSVRRILNSMYSENDFLNSWEIESLRRHFTYHDVMASVMTSVSRTNPLSLNERDPWHFQIPPTAMLTTVDPLMGISYYLYSLICRIQYVTTPTPAFPQISEAAFAATEREIQEWKYESPFSFENIDMPIALDLIALAESCRIAALIQLYRSSEAHRLLVPGLASRAWQFISRIPPGSPADSSLLYPIFLAGSELESEEEITKCSQRLKAIQERNRYENVGDVQTVLREVWRPVLNGEKRRDWEDVLKEWGWFISLS